MVEFEAYPPPHSWSWSYQGKRLLNTTEHVITLHRHNYRYSELTASQLGSERPSVHRRWRQFVHLTRYISVLRLVRVLGSEGGIYTFSARHEDASVALSIHVYVSSKYSTKQISLTNCIYVLYFLILVRKANIKKSYNLICLSKHPKKASVFFSIR